MEKLDHSIDYKGGGTSSHFPKRVMLITLGCPKNQADSEVLAGQLQADGVLLVDEASEADAILINTCGFIEDAKTESIDTILEALHYKSMDSRKKVYVWGCLSERYRGEIEKEIPEIDGYFGVEAFEELRSLLTGRIGPCDPGLRPAPNPAHTAYLKIAEGCDHRCAFCAIPLFKGKYRSRPLEVLLHEARALAARGVKELVLVAQDTTAYGSDLQNGTDLVRLIRSLLPIEGIAWIRLLYGHPSHITEPLIDLLAGEEKLCRYLDLPLQHIADPILKKMARGTTRDEIERLIERLRHRIPKLTLRTAFLVGFPGETEAHFSELLGFVQSVRFERLGAFMYSPEEGTPAYGERRPSRKTAEERYNRLMDVQEAIAEERNAGLVGQVLPVLIDGVEGTYSHGRTPGDAPEVDQTVWIPHPCPVAQILPVRIQLASAFDLEGEVAS